MFTAREKKKVFNDNCKIVIGDFRTRLQKHFENRGYTIVECYNKGNGDFLIIQDKQTGSYRQKVVVEKNVINTLRLFGVRY